MNLAQTQSKVLRVLESPSPRKIKRINYAVTLLCNAFCKMCNIWRNGKGKNVYHREQELTVADLERVFGDESLLEGLEDLVLTGGEPFLREDLAQVASFFLERFSRARVTVNSNFYLPEAILPFVQAIEAKRLSDRLTLCFSIDGVQKTHDKLRGVPDGFETIASTVARLRQSSSIPLVMSFTILPQNCGEIEDVYRLSQSWGTGFTFRFADVTSNYYANENMTFAWQPDQLAAARQQIARIVASIRSQRSALRRWYNSDLYFFSRLVEYREKPQRLFTCYSGTHSMYLDAFGTVFPCIILDSKLGNLKEQSLEEIWFSAEADRVRKDIADAKCHCWTECETIPSLQRLRWHHAM